MAKLSENMPDVPRRVLSLNAVVCFDVSVGKKSPSEQYCRSIDRYDALEALALQILFKHRFS